MRKDGRAGVLWGVAAPSGASAVYRCAAALLAAAVSACAANGGTADAGTESSGAAASASGETTWQPADAVCGDIVSEEVARSGVTAHFWGCCYACGLYASGTGDAWDVTVAASRDSYAMLDPASECHALRTALYECLATLTCAELLAWHEAINEGGVATCSSEYDALAPKRDECGI